MANTIAIDPVTRLEGHLAVSVEVEGGRVVSARSQGEMFRGFEVILRGRHPMDAQQITQRICGVCPVDHGIASVLAQDAAYGVTPPANGRLMRNLALAANFIQSHIVHFYVLSALDFVDVAAITGYRGENPALVDLRNWVTGQLNGKLMYPAAPFLPRYGGDYLEDAAANFSAVNHYLQSLEMRRVAHRLVATLAGKVPHAAGLVPGGMTGEVGAREIAAMRAQLEKLLEFVDNAYLPDVVAVARAFPHYFEIGRGCGNYLVYGVFPESGEPGHTWFPSGVLKQGRLEPFQPERVAEQVKHSWFSQEGSGRHPYEGETNPQPDKAGAYSWLKAPRYGGEVMEVGPLARVLVSLARNGDAALQGAVEGLLTTLNLSPTLLNSTLGRHAARALECKRLVEKSLEWVKQLKPGEPAYRDFTLPDRGRGAGLSEAARGALGHWLEIEGGRIKNYQCVVPTTWNCSPRDDRGQPGALEQALVGTPIADPRNPIEAARVVRSFDPCLACAVH